MGLSLEWLCPGVYVYVCVRRIGSAEVFVGAAWQRGLTDDLTRARVIQPKCTLWLRAGVGPDLVIDPIRRPTTRSISPLPPLPTCLCARSRLIHPPSDAIYNLLRITINRAAGHGRDDLVFL